MRNKAPATVAFLIAIAMSTLGCSSHMYAEQAKAYASVFTDELVKAGVCANREVCQSRQAVLWSAGGWKVGSFSGGGVEIQVYGIADHQIADALVALGSRLHKDNPAVALALTVQANAHIDNLNPGTPVVIRTAQFDAKKTSGRE